MHTGICDTFASPKILNRTGTTTTQFNGLTEGSFQKFDRRPPVHSFLIWRCAQGGSKIALRALPNHIFGANRVTKCIQEQVRGAHVARPAPPSMFEVFGESGQGCAIMQSAHQNASEPLRGAKGAQRSFTEGGEPKGSKIASNPPSKRPYEPPNT